MTIFFGIYFLIVFTALCLGMYYQNISKSFDLNKDGFLVEMKLRINSKML
jgi:hypothetical protein